MLILLLAEGRAGEVCKPLYKAVFFRVLGRFLPFLTSHILRATVLYTQIFTANLLHNKYKYCATGW